jgi:hypothetical protein
MRSSGRAWDSYRQLAMATAAATSAAAIILLGRARVRFLHLTLPDLLMERGNG